MSYISSLRCLLCGREYKPIEVIYTCPRCGYNGILEVNYNYEGIKKVFTKESLENNFPEQLKKCSECDGYSTYFNCYHGGH